MKMMVFFKHGMTCILNSCFFTWKQITRVKTNFQKSDKKVLLGTPSDPVTIEKEKKINHEIRAETKRIFFS